MGPSAATILKALAELAPAGTAGTWNVTRGGQPLAWVPEAAGPLDDPMIPRLAALDALHREERILRRGWGMVVGPAEIDGKKRDLMLPLMTQPVRLERRLTGFRITEAGDLELTPLIGDRELAAQLEAAPGLAKPGWLAAPGTAAWLTTAAGAAGLPQVRVLEAGATVPRGELVVVRQPALFAVRDVYSAAMRDVLLTWSQRPGIEDTALAAVYGLDRGDAQPVAQPGEFPSPLPLNAAQADVVRAARRERVVVVSGPPGNGKSHTVIATAMSLVDEGASVLVATQSPHAADVLGELADRYPGPRPVLFGDSERRTAIADWLGRRGEVDDDDAAAALTAAAREAHDRVRELVAGIRDALELERRSAEQDRWEPLIPAMSAELPSVFRADADLPAVLVLADALQAVPAGWWQRWRWRRAVARMRRATGVVEDVTPQQLRAAAAAAGTRQAAARLAATGGTDLGPAWRALGEADAAFAEASGRAMLARSRSAQRWTRDARRSAAALGTALRSGRSRRRQILARVAGDSLVRAVPLWIGTVADVEDLLPPMPGLFDLVILDEASHVDQIRAAPVLARAGRAMVVGDPRQLRFVSFVADVDVASTLDRYGLDDRVDVRRVSAFDLATGAAKVTWLDEHYRCAPHLIEFSAKRFYHGEIGVATRHPRNDSTDVIDVVRVAGATVTDGVNGAEVAEVLRIVRRLAEQGRRSIGVVTPFRAQADALESALLAEFRVDEIERIGLRVGTVHSFQGSEAEVVVASLGLVDGDAAGRIRFVADPALFNVLVTRARSQMIVVTSLTTGNGVIGDYLEYGEKGAAAPADAGTAAGWAGELAAELRRAGHRVRTQYPVGRWSVDLCVGAGAAAVGLLCGVHPDGVDAHVARQRALSRAGWQLVDAFASRWSADPVRAALDIGALHFPPQRATG